MQKIKFEYRITALYILFGGLWIIFSDELLRYFIEDSDRLTTLQTSKGWFYVLITSILFYMILNKHLIKLRYTEQKARESESLKTAFLHNISHEIRTPMNSIIGFAELLKDEKLAPEKREEYITIINSSSNQLLNTVEEIIDISMIETGNITIAEKKVNINNLMHDIYTFFLPLIKKDVSFFLSYGLPDDQSLILTDEFRIRKTLSGIINNAIKFTEQGHISIGYNLKDNELEFFIEDTGTGIPLEIQDTIFISFRKGEKELMKFYEGLGLGLSISKGNIELLNGRIWLKSEQGKGSTFYFTIPYKPEI